MNPVDIHTISSSGGLLGLYALLAALVGGLVFALKTDAFTSLLAKFGAGPLPKKAIPWIALGLGFAGGALQALIAGKSLPDAALAGGWGLMSGAFAIAGDQTVGKAVESGKIPSVASVAVISYLAVGAIGAVDVACTPTQQAQAKTVIAYVDAGLQAADRACILTETLLGKTEPKEITAACGILDAALPLVEQEIAVNKRAFGAVQAIKLAEKARASK